jgi:hypothetical protein
MRTVEKIVKNKSDVEVIQQDIFGIAEDVMRTANEVTEHSLLKIDVDISRFQSN